MTSVSEVTNSESKTNIILQRIYSTGSVLNPTHRQQSSTGSMAEASSTTVPIVARDSEPTASESFIPPMAVPSLVLPGAKQTGDVSSQVPDDGPVPLSFPAILRNPKLVDRYAHLRERSVAAPPKASISKARRDEHEGKRWIRRRENGPSCRYSHASHALTFFSACS